MVNAPPVLETSGHAMEYVRGGCATPLMWAEGGMTACGTKLPIAALRHHGRYRDFERYATTVVAFVRLADVRSDQERVRDGAASNGAHERSPVGEDRQAHGVQTGQRRCENVATIEGRKSVAQSRPRRQIPKRHRGHQNAGSPRRLIDLVTQLPA